MIYFLLLIVSLFQPVSAEEAVAASGKPVSSFNVVRGHVLASCIKLDMAREQVQQILGRHPTGFGAFDYWCDCFEAIGVRITYRLGQLEVTVSQIEMLAMPLDR